MRFHRGVVSLGLHFFLLFNFLSIWFYTYSILHVFGHSELLSFICCCCVDFFPFLFIVCYVEWSMSHIVIWIATIFCLSLRSWDQTVNLYVRCFFFFCFYFVLVYALHWIHFRLDRLLSSHKIISHFIIINFDKVSVIPLICDCFLFYLYLISYSFPFRCTQWILFNSLMTMMKWFDPRNLFFWFE